MRHDIGVRAGGGVREPSDEELLTAIAAGPGALPEFYRRHVAKVIGIGVRRFGNPEDVADFAADVFVELMSSAHRFDPRRGSAVAWLYGLATHVAAAQRRRQARTSDAQRRLSGRSLLDDGDYERVDEQIDAAAAVRETYVAMQGLTDSDRRLLELVAVDGLQPAQAAKALGVSPVAARVRLARARQRLRAALTASNHPTVAGTDAESIRHVETRPVGANVAKEESA